MKPDRKDIEARIRSLLPEIEATGAPLQPVDISRILDESAARIKTAKAKKDAAFQDFKKKLLT